jgi:2-C-methyl-D-erythritol 2,4-cyclodiphosphate synthase
MRVGIGYDVHRFDGKRPLKLGGITIPHSRGLSGHSDADVLLHALTDALLGAVGAGDIGDHFPSDDPRTRGADSRLFVQAASRLIRRKGWRVGNVDTTVIADAPPLSGYRTRMREAISELLRIPDAQVSVKAKTTEAFCPGQGGIAAHAVVLLKKRGQGRGRRPKQK